MSTSNQVRHTVLLAGIDAKSVAARFPNINGDELARELDASFAKLNAVPNLTVTLCWLFLEDEQPAERIVKALKEATYDAVLIGWGVRGFPENSAMFEQVVEAVRRNASLDTKLIFSTTADDHLLAITRHFPDVQV